MQHIGPGEPGAAQELHSSTTTDAISVALFRYTPCLQASPWFSRVGVVT